MATQTTPGGNINFTTPAELTDPTKDRERALNRDARDREVQAVAGGAATDAAAALATLGVVRQEAAGARTAAQQSASSAAASRNAAEDAQGTADRFGDDIELLKQMAQIEPGSVVDAQTALLVQDPESETHARLNAQSVQVAVEYAGIGSDAVQPFLDVIENGTRDAHVLLIGDSTGNETWEWVYLFFQDLAARYPSHTFHYRRWNDNAQAYDPAVTVGSGSWSVTFWNASVPGATTQFWMGARATPAIVTVPADLVLISLGHNELNTSPAQWRSRYMALTESIVARKPTAHLALVSQNPVRSNNLQAQRIEVYKEIATRQGYGFIDAHAAFRADGRDLTIDGIHPGPEGARLWADAVLTAFQRTRAEPRPQQPSLLSRRAVENLLPNGALTQWAGSTPTGWIASGATIAKDTAGMESGAAAAVITATSANGSVYINLDATKVKGKTYTLAVRAKVSPAAGDNAAARLAFYDGAAQTMAQGSPASDGYRWIIHTGTFSPTTTTARIYLYAGNAGSILTVDRIVMSEGLWPTDAGELDISGGATGGADSTAWSTPAGLSPANGATFNALQIRRQGNTVYCRVDQLALPANASQMIVATVPTGYRSNGGPAGAVGNSITQLLGTGDSNQRFVQYMSISGGNLFWSAAWDTTTMAAAGQPARVDGIFMWHTEDPMPA